jgi:hypothetical protein
MDWKKVDRPQVSFLSLNAGYGQFVVAVSAVDRA